jgi:hypothetical protein
MWFCNLGIYYLNILICAITIGLIIDFTDFKGSILPRLMASIPMYFESGMGHMPSAPTPLIYNIQPLKSP